MNYSIKNLKTATTMIKNSVFGKKKEYTLKFNHESDGRWYIDFPNWPFDHHNLMMVAGADKLCDRLSVDGKETRVNVIPTNKQETHESYIELHRTNYSLTGGADYEVKGLEGFARKIWLCPVTLFVLGKYPAYMYIKKV